MLATRQTAAESWDWQREEGREREMGLYLQSNFNGENGSENNVKIKQNLQNKNKQDGGGWAGHKQERGEVSGCSPEKGKHFKTRCIPRTPPEPFHTETGEETGRKDFPTLVPTQSWHGWLWLGLVSVGR